MTLVFSAPPPKKIAKNERMEWVDCVRGLAILIVLLGHSRCPTDMYHFIYGFHMPFFFILSGFLFNYEKWKSASFLSFLKSRIRCYLIPYFFLSTICLFAQLLMDCYSSSFSVSKTLSYVKWILYSSVYTAPHCVQMWFLVTLFVASLMFYGLLLLFEKNMVAGLLGCFFSIIVNYDLNMFSVQIFPAHTDVAMIAVLFMFVGFIFRKYNLLNKSLPSYALIALFLIGCYAIFSNSGIDMNNRVYGNYLLMFIGAISIGFFLLYLFSKFSVSNKFLSYFGQNTILIIGFDHLIKDSCSMLYGLFAEKKDPYCPWYFLFVFYIISFCIILTLFNLLSRKLPFLNVLVGKKVTRKSERN